MVNVLAIGVGLDSTEASTFFSCPCPCHVFCWVGWLVLVPIYQFPNCRSKVARGSRDQGWA